MNIKINGQAEQIEEANISVSRLLKIKNVDMPEMVSVEHNGEILDRNQFDTVNVKEGDEVEFLYFMGGGRFRQIRRADNDRISV